MARKRQSALHDDVGRVRRSVGSSYQISNTVMVTSLTSGPGPGCTACSWPQRERERVELCQRRSGSGWRTTPETTISVSPIVISATTTLTVSLVESPLSLPPTTSTLTSIHTITIIITPHLHPNIARCAPPTILPPVILLRHPGPVLAYVPPYLRPRMHQALPASIHHSPPPPPAPHAPPTPPPPPRPRAQQAPHPRHRRRCRHHPPRHRLT
jgi:hypothetical protein